MEGRNDRSHPYFSTFKVRDKDNNKVENESKVTKKISIAETEQIIINLTNSLANTQEILNILYDKNKQKHAELSHWYHRALSLKGEIDELEITNKNLSNEHERLKKELFEGEKQSALLINQINQLNDHYSFLLKEDEKKKFTLMVQCTELRNSYITLENKNKSLQAENEEYKKQIMTLTNENKKLLRTKSASSNQKSQNQITGRKRNRNERDTCIGSPSRSGVFGKTNLEILPPGIDKGSDLNPQEQLIRILNNL